MESQWQSTTNESHVRCSEYILRINNTLCIVGIRALFFFLFYYTKTKSTISRVGISPVSRLNEIFIDKGGRYSS